MISKNKSAKRKSTSTLSPMMINRSKKKKSQFDDGMQIWSIAGDLILEMHMIQIPFFIESSDNSILLQPQVNF
jgi:hypothetical protein